MSLNISKTSISNTIDINHSINYIMSLRTLIEPYNKKLIDILLYYCQLMHLFRTRKPLFSNPIIATSWGCIVNDYIPNYNLSEDIVLSTSKMVSIQHIITFFGSHNLIQLIQVIHDDLLWSNTYRHEDTRLTLVNMLIYVTQGYVFQHKEL